MEGSASTKEKIALFWPGDARHKPNELALPEVTEATVQLERALAKLGRATYRVEGFLAKPHEAIEKLGPIDDPMIGVCAHWFYAPHTTDGVVGKENPLLLASNFSGRWPGLVGLLNTGASLEMLNRRFARAWTSSPDFSADADFMDRLDAWCRTGRIAYAEDEISYHAPIARAASELAKRVADGIRRRRILILMLGDTSMGMINGYFGPRLLNLHGFTEHKVDQAWIIDRGRRIEDKRIDDAWSFVKDRGVTFHHGERGAADFDENATREQLRDYLVVLDLVNEFKADAIGWQYQLGMIRCARRRISQRACSTRRAAPSRTETPSPAPPRPIRERGADGADEAALEGERPAPGGDVPRRALGRRARGPLPLGPPQLGLVRRVCLQSRREHAARGALVPSAFALFPHARRDCSRARACLAR